MCESKKSCGDCSQANRVEGSTEVLICENPLSGAYNTHVLKTEYCNGYRKATKEWERHINRKFF